MTVVEPALDEPVPEPIGETPPAGPPRERAHDGSGPPPATPGREWAVLGIVAVVVAVAMLGPAWGRFAPDTRPDLYQHPGRLLASSLQAWVGGSNGLGQGNFNTGVAPVAAVVWVIRTLGAPAWLAVRIWRLLLIAVGAWGLRRYLGALFGDRLSSAGRTVATVFWIVNPYVLVGGNTTPILLPYALLPWTLLALVRALRSPQSWRWPAAFALGFFAQTGLNAGVVPFFQLVAVPVHLVYAGWADRVPTRSLVRVLVRCGLLAFVVSCYWLVPASLASGTGSGIAATTEAPRDVARTSSYAETARLLGAWPIYGRSGTRLFVPEDVGFLTNPLVVLASFLVPVGVAVSVLRTRSRERLLGAGLLLVGLPIMVGIFPPDHPPPAGWTLRWVFDHVAASLAFRTTNKVGAVVTLAYAVLLAVGVTAWSRRVAHRPRPRLRRALAYGSATLVLVGATLPMWDRALNPGSYRIPGYWERALAALDRHDRDARVLVVPGGTGGNYRWGVRSPDDLFPSLLDRPVAVRNTVVGRGDPAANFLAGFDTALHDGSLPAGALSATARYLGAADVLLRSDLLTEEISGAPPYVVRQQVASDPGLRLEGQYGRAGEHTLPGTARSGSDAGIDERKAKAADRRDAAIHPVETYAVADPEPVIRAEPAAKTVVVDGDGSAVSGLAAFGAVDGTQPLRLLGGFDADDLATAARDGGRFVLTDTNRRRAADINRVTDATSPTLRADQDIDAGTGSTLTLWPDDARKQAVSSLVGARRIDASRPAFGLRPFGKPAAAFDGDPNTAWQTGELQTAAGDRIAITFDRPRRVSQLTVRFAEGGPSRIDRLAVVTDDGTTLEPVPSGADDATYAIPPTRTRTLELRILHQTAGDNPVGIAEVELPGLRVAEVLQLPRTYDRLVRAAGPEVRRQVAALPLDLVFERARGSAADLGDDEENIVDRRFALPQSRTFSFRAQLPFERLDPDLRTLLYALGRGQQAPCQVVGFLDSTPIRARVTSPKRDLAIGKVVDLEGCRSVRAEAGSHRFISSFAWVLDRVQLASPGAARPSTAAAPKVELGTQRATRQQFSVARATGPYWVRLGQAYDERWRLRMDGKDLGAPELIDGYSSGWRIADPGPHRFEATFPAQRAVQATFALSAVGVVGVVALAAWPVGAPVPWSRRREDAAPVNSTDPPVAGP